MQTTNTRKGLIGRCASQGLMTLPHIPANAFTIFALTTAAFTLLTTAVVGEKNPICGRAYETRQVIMALKGLDMPLDQLWVVLPVAAILYYLTTTFISWYRLRHIPGPRLAAFSYLWLARTAMSGKQWWVYRDMCQQYGPLIRVGPNELSTDDPEVLRQINAARGSYVRDPWYVAARFDPYHDNVFTMLHADQHDRFKAKIASAYAGKGIPALEEGIDDQIRALLDLLRRKYLTQAVDLAEITSFFSMDVITRSAFGREFGYLKTDSDVYGFLGGVRDNWAALAVALDIPYIRRVLFSSWFLKYFGPKATDQTGLGKLMGVAEEVVAKRFAPDGKQEKDMLGSFIDHGLTRQECATEALFMIIAGFENTSCVIRTTMLYLMTSPRVTQKLKMVISETIRNGKASHPITYEEAKRIPYLQAVVYEGIRMRPPAPGLYPKSVPPQGDVIQGKFIPGGTAIGMNTGSLVRSKALFGQDADFFRPERFMEADETKRAEMERNTEMVFGYGRWMCAGKPVAFMEIHKVLFELTRAFDFQLVDPMKPWNSISYSQFIDEDMWVPAWRG
ncbi:putative BcABA1, cytochrome P450 monooxygenase [Seiridium unicorne]|uniref:BcABA1, cytochrome P450 monooxygenase n=1 Tax=Seiridium unicorne TaxID=138068 RepID=A0ABR2UU37_9PEZI